MTNPEVNILVPFGYSEVQPEREALLHFVIENCVHDQTYKNTRITLVESSTSPTQERYALQNCDSYIFLPINGGVYSPALVQNTGFLKSKDTEFTYVHQADFLLPPNMIECAVAKMIELDAPFIFPYFSSINLSKPLTEALLNQTVNWKHIVNALETINTSVRGETNVSGMAKRKYFNSAEIAPLVLVLPPELQVASLLALSNQQVWGEDDGNFTYFGDSFQVVQPSETLVKYRPGGRAKASYLARSVEYDRVGGSPNYVGWGYEDLGLWARVQAFYAYERKKDGDMYFNDKSFSTNHPIIHLWHSTANRLEYFAKTEENRLSYENFVAMSREEKVKAVQPLGKYS